MSARQDEDHIWAGLLNGVMVTALGAAFPVMVAWQVAVRWPDLVGGRYDLDPVQLGQGATMVAVSGALVRFGVRMIRRHLIELKTRQLGAE